MSKNAKQKSKATTFALLVPVIFNLFLSTLNLVTLAVLSTNNETLIGEYFKHEKSFPYISRIMMGIVILILPLLPLIYFMVGKAIF